MQESTFRIIMRPDNIGVIIVDDTSEATLRHWHDYSIADMAILTSNNTVSALVNVALSVQAGGHFQLFTEESQAITWLHQKVPD